MSGDRLVSRRFVGACVVAVLAVSLTPLAGCRAVPAPRKAPAESVRTTNDVPMDEWSEAIGRLAPLRVYEHNNNLVVVQSVEDGVQQGVYINRAVSSYYPVPGSEDDGFVFGEEVRDGEEFGTGSTVLDFVRDVP